MFITAIVVVTVVAEAISAVVIVGAILIATAAASARSLKEQDAANPRTFPPPLPPIASSRWLTGGERR